MKWKEVQVRKFGDKMILGLISRYVQISLTIPTTIGWLLAVILVDSGEGSSSDFGYPVSLTSNGELVDTLWEDDGDICHRHLQARHAGALDDFSIVLLETQCVIC
jgi:hypothetical protein